MFHFPRRKESEKNVIRAVEIELIQYFWLFLGNFCVRHHLGDFEACSRNFEADVHVSRLHSVVNLPFLIFVT
jgi:hypothetical protein